MLSQNEPEDGADVVNPNDTGLDRSRDDTPVWDIAPWIGDVLKGLRVGRGLTQMELADLLADSLLDRRVDQSYVSRVEHGEMISLRRLGLFCHVLRCRLSDVIRTAEELVDFARLRPKDKIQTIIGEIMETVESR